MISISLLSPDIQKHGAPGRGEEETEEEEEEEEGAGRGRHGQSGARQAQLEWDDSTLPY